MTAIPLGMSSAQLRTATSPFRVLGAQQMRSRLRDCMSVCDCKMQYCTLQRRETGPSTIVHGTNWLMFPLYY